MIETRATDRILNLSVIDGEKGKSATGLVDTRLFTGEQKLLIKMDPSSCLWYFQYSKSGLLPEPLQGRYTGFKAAFKFAEDYFRKRNIKVTREN